MDSSRMKLPMPTRAFQKRQSHNIPAETKQALQATAMEWPELSSGGLSPKLVPTSEHQAVDKGVAKFKSQQRSMISPIQQQPWNPDHIRSKNSQSRQDGKSLGRSTEGRGVGHGLSPHISGRGRVGATTAGRGDRGRGGQAGRGRGLQGGRGPGRGPGRGRSPTSLLGQRAGRGRGGAGREASSSGSGKTTPLVARGQKPAQLGASGPVALLQRPLLAPAQPSPPDASVTDTVTDGPPLLSLQSFADEWPALPLAPKPTTGELPVPPLQQKSDSVNKLVGTPDDETNDGKQVQQATLKEGQASKKSALGGKFSKVNKGTVYSSAKSKNVVFKSSNTEKPGKSAMEQFEEAIKPVDAKELLVAAGLRPKKKSQLAPGGTGVQFHPAVAAGAAGAAAAPPALAAPPRKKRLTALKKRIFRERMARAADATAVTSDDGKTNLLPAGEQRAGGGGGGGSWWPPGRRVVVRGLVAPEDCEDEEEFEETLADVRSMLERYGRLLNLFVPRGGGGGGGGPAPAAPAVAALYGAAAGAAAAAEGLHHRVVGGQLLNASVMDLGEGFFPGMWEVQLPIPTTFTDVEALEFVEAVQKRASRCGQHCIDVVRTSEHFGGAAAVVIATFELEHQAQNFSILCTTFADGEDQLLQQIMSSNTPKCQQVPPPARAVTAAAAAAAEEEGARGSPRRRRHHGVAVAGLAAPEDLEDPEEAEEVAEDIAALVHGFGELVALELPTAAAGAETASGGQGGVGGPEEEPLVRLYFTTAGAAAAAAAGLAGRVVGGRALRAAVLPPPPPAAAASAKEGAPVAGKGGGGEAVAVAGLVAPGDLADPEEAEEVAADVRALAEGFGTVLSINLPDPNDDAEESITTVVYSSSEEAQAAVSGFCLKTVGGLKLSSWLLTSKSGQPFVAFDADNSNGIVPHDSNAGENGGSAAIDPELSGKKSVQQRDGALTPEIGPNNKYIPLKYQGVKECAPLPKPTTPRRYDIPPDDPEINENVKQLLSTLIEFQKRTQLRDPNNAKKKKRLVMGFNEVKRGLRSGKVTTLIIAPDIQSAEMEGSLDDQVREVLELAERRMGGLGGGGGKPLDVVFALSKRKIGKALGKTIKISCVGIYNADGAFDVLKRIRKRLDALKNNNDAKKCAC